MKTIITKTLLVIAGLLMLIIRTDAQSTYQTAVRVASSSLGIVPDSNAVIQPGIPSSCVISTKQPVWFFLGFCETTNMELSFQAFHQTGNLTDTCSVIIFGPFTDTTDISNKLVLSNIDTCRTFYIPSYSQNTDLTLFYNNYQAGQIYYAMATSSKNVNSIRSWVYGGPFAVQGDTVHCKICNGKVSDLLQGICAITLDSATQKNKLVWTKDLNGTEMNYVLFRQNSLGNYDTLGFQSISQLSEFIDITSNPGSKSYTYKIGIQDSCGYFVQTNSLNNGSYPTRITTHLISYPAGINSANLIWNTPWHSYNSNYYVTRTDAMGNYAILDSLFVPNGTLQLTFSDLNAPSGLNNYQVMLAIPGGCTSSLIANYYLEKSNFSSAIVTGIEGNFGVDYLFSIAPNPFSSEILINFSNQNAKQTSVCIKNVLGQTVFTKALTPNSQPLYLDLSFLENGIYFLEVLSNENRVVKKIVKQ